MKLIHLMLFATVVIGVSCSTKPVVLTEDNLPENLLYLPNKIKPYTGKAIIYFSNSDIVKEEMNFKRGVLHGERIRYYKNGEIKLKGSYREGNFDGKWIANMPQGERAYEVVYKNDTLEGDFVSWYKTGVMKEKTEFSKNIVVGEALCFDEAGMRLKVN